jgi:hypothetical protein
LDLRLQRVDVLPKFLPTFLPIIIILLLRSKSMKFLLDDLVVIVKPLDVAAASQLQLLLLRLSQLADTVDILDIEDTRRSCYTGAVSQGALSPGWVDG